MTSEEINDYIDDIIHHALSLVEYGNYFSSAIKGFADGTREECSRILLEAKRSVTVRQRKELDNQIHEILAEFQNKVDEFIAEQLKEIAEKEEEYLKNNVGKKLGVNFTIPATVVGILSLVPIVSMGSAKEFGKNTANKLGKIYNSMINQSQIFGEDYKDIFQEYESQFNTFDRGLNTEADTLGYSLSNEFDRIVFTKTDSPKLKYMWSAILDTTTCLACGMLDHKVFENIQDVPMYPLHFMCRCMLVTGTDEIFSEYPESYQKWFEEQPEKDKYDILGKTRYGLYKQGMEIKQFVNNNKVTPLKLLKTYNPIVNTLYPNEKI